MGQIFLYNHGGSENHGCEALVRTACQLLDTKSKVSVLSEVPQQDYYYEIHHIAEIKPAKLAVSKLSLDFLKAYISLKKTGDYFPMDILPYRKAIKGLRKEDVEISVGGDIYCYEDYPKYIKLHELIHKRGCQSVLLGCSMEPELFDDPRFVKDMKRYDYISARETMTYDLLVNAGITNVDYNPDSAFALPTAEVELPEGFVEENTIGINLSPLVVRKGSSQGIVVENFKNLIQWILTNTDCNVALIPHVIWDGNDDRTALKELLQCFGDEKRIVLIEDNNCMRLKGYISKCRFFVGARTHSTIAAYSSMVPTLVLGYSIKSRGIAKDLFGTDENYVLLVEKLQSQDDMVKAFQWIWEREIEIKETLDAIMPEYIQKTNLIKGKIEKAIGRDI